MIKIRPVLIFMVLACALFCLPARTIHGQEGKSINFSFDQVEVRTFVKLVGDLTGRKFVVADDVQGKITIVSPRVALAEVYPLFMHILESVGATVVQDGLIARVVALPRRDVPLAPVIGPDEKTPQDGLVMKVLRPVHVSSSELKKLLESKVGGGKIGAVSSFEETNHLVVIDTAEGIRRVEKIIEQIDQPGLSRVWEVVSLVHAGAEDLASQLNMAMAEIEQRGAVSSRRLPAAVGQSGADLPKGMTVVAAPHSNSLILAGTAAQIQELRQIIQQMDVEATSGRGRLNAIFLRYLSAEEAAKSINALLQKTATRGEKNPAPSRIAIEASVSDNALLVDATPSDLDVVRKLIEQLDRAPQQVHVSVIIAEHSVSDEFTLGIDMAAVDMPSKVGATVVQGASTLQDSTDGIMNAIQNGIFPKGITVGLARGASTAADGTLQIGHPAVVNLNAMQKNGQFKILSETSLEAENNREASVNIVNEIPILKSTIQGGSGTARDVIQNIERLDVGIKLKLTPHIIPGGEVRMVLNPSIEAVIDPGASGTFTPTIAKREISTTVTVPDGQMIVIAGLTREDKSKVVKKVPLLGSIPLLGILFRSTTDMIEKTNLLIFVTPWIMGGNATEQNMMDTWRNKTGLDPYGQK